MNNEKSLKFKSNTDQMIDLKSLDFLSPQNNKLMKNLNLET